MTVRGALKKRAVGYSAEETVEEYTANADGELALSKKKISVKHIPPDMAAIREMLSRQKVKGKFDSYTDEELMEERGRLAAELAENGEETGRE